MNLHNAHTERCGVVSAGCTIIFENKTMMMTKHPEVLSRRTAVGVDGTLHTIHKFYDVVVCPHSTFGAS